MKYSKGPWSLSPVDRSPKNINSGDGDCIAHVYLTNIRTRKRDAEHLGNAKLMAAADRMYELLKRCDDQLEDRHKLGYDVADFIKEMEKCPNP